MRKLPLRLASALLCLCAVGCMQQSDTRSYYIHGDGKVDFMMWLDNIHSSEDTAAKRAEEEKKWLGEFKAGTTSELKQLKSASAHLTQSRLLRDKAPFSAIIQGRYETPRDFATFLDLSPTDPKSKLEFVKDGKKRTLTIHSEREKPAPGAKEVPASKEEEDAVTEIFWRFVPLGGTLTASKACIISRDKRSCLLDVPEIERQGRNSGGMDLSLSWTLD